MLHNSGAGKAVLSPLDDERVQRLVSQAGMPPKTANTITTLKLFTDVEATRERGYAIDEEEQELGVRCIAVPVPGAPTPMAISVSGPVTRVDEAFMQTANTRTTGRRQGTGARLLPPTSLSALQPLAAERSSTPEGSARCQR